MKKKKIEKKQYTLTQLLSAIDLAREVVEKKTIDGNPYTTIKYSTQEILFAILHK